MKKKPRYYQQEAVDASMSKMNEAMREKRSFHGIVEAGPGAGKTLKMAMIADRLSSKGFNILIMSRQPVLCGQNYDECWDYGVPSAMYAAKFKRKQLNANTVVATEGTIVNALTSDFKNHRFDLILIDEAHMVDYEEETSQFMRIIRHFEANAKRIGNCRPLQILGLTGSPYRGIQRISPPLGAKRNDEAFWQETVYDIGVEKLTSEGYLTRAVYGFADDHDNDLNFDGVNTLPNSWEFDEAALNEIVLSGEGKKKLIGILTEVKAKTVDRNQVIVFASTKRHAAEVMNTLIALGEKPDTIGMVTDDNTEAERDAAVSKSKAGKLKWLVNVSCLTTGFDSPLIDVVLFLRPVGSLALLMQCLGRAARLLKPEHEERGFVKPDYLVLDYAGVFDRLGHLLDNPMIDEANLQKAQKEKRIIHCPKCKAENFDTARRCIGKVHELHPDFGTEHEMDGRCGHFWKHILCPFCETQNDISAGVCRNPKCKGELKDPNRQLLNKAYSDSELVDVTGMSVEPGRGGAIVVKYTLANASAYHGQPTEILFDVGNKGRKLFGAWVDQHVEQFGWRRQVKMLKCVDKILSNKKLFRTPAKIAYRVNEKGRFSVGRKVF